MLKIFIADDHPLFRDAIISVIRERFAQVHIAEADDLPAALAALLLAEDTSAEIHGADTEYDGWDLLLLDLNMPGMDGLNGLIQVRNALPDMTVIVVSAEVERQTILQAMNFGAAGYIPKSSSRTQMADAIEKVLAGDVYVPAEILRQTTAPTSTTAQMVSSQLQQEALHALTRKQLQVLERMTRGESNKQIAHHLNIAETTVKTHVSAILRQLGAQNRVQAILAAKQLDFTPYLRP